MERLQHPFAVVDADDRVEPLDAAHLGANLAAARGWAPPDPLAVLSGMVVHETDPVVGVLLGAQLISAEPAPTMPVRRTHPERASAMPELCGAHLSSHRPLAREEDSRQRERRPEGRRRPTSPCGERRSG